uniref:Uncharacterized protein n=1 Tax=uncultured Acidobacteriales bacterium HF0200_23L05 TaxID=710732 RepID=E0XUM1_9BACT|nr:hypothetical protein [uncultured Acidobacteriales bacterium HF0200_23L05]
MASFDHCPSKNRMLCGISPHYRGCPPLEGRSPTRYSPVCHSNRNPKVTFAFDLHV